MAYRHPDMALVPRWLKRHTPALVRTFEKSRIVRCLCYALAGAVTVTAIMLYLEYKMKGIPEDKLFVWLGALMLGLVSGPLFGFLWELDRSQDKKDDT